MFYTSYGDHMSAEAIIQHQTEQGNWIEVSRAPNESQVIIQAMENVQSLYPRDRIRAVDEGGRVLDILT